MALIKCKECGNVVSSTAQACPKCGAKVARQPIGCGSAIGIIFLLLIAVASVQSIFRTDTIPSAPSSTSEPVAVAPAPKCDRAAAERVQSMLRGMATWQEKDGVITFKLGSDWDHAAPHERLGLVRSFADSDACLASQARGIDFYRTGKLVATASPSSGIHLID